MKILDDISKGREVEWELLLMEADINVSDALKMLEKELFGLIMNFVPGSIK